MRKNESLYSEDWFKIGAKELKRAKNLFKLNDLKGAGFNIQQLLEKYGFLLCYHWKRKYFVLVSRATQSNNKLDWGKSEEMRIIFSNHALFEMNRRKIEKYVVENVLNNPNQRITSKKSRIIIQGKYLNQYQNKEMLLRIIGEQVNDMFYIITVYKTSKIKKYWEKEG